MGRRAAAGQAMMRALLLCAALLCAQAAQPIVTPSEINTCSNSSSDTAPQVSRVHTCASASVMGVGLGSAASFATSQARVLRVAAAACGDAVAGSLGELCAGADPMATMVSLANTCGAALAALYAQSLTGSASFDIGPKALQGNVTRAGRLLACGSACGNAQGAAQAFAQAAACGVAAATDSCIAATSLVQTRAFARAFVKGASDSWGRACAGGHSAALSGGDTIAATAAASIATAMGAVAASACASCPTCKCQPLPASLSLAEAGGDVASAAAAIAGGRVGLAHAISHATTAYCTSSGNGTVQPAKTHAQSIITSFADLLMGAAGAARGFAHAAGDGAWACGSGSLASDLAALRDASSQVLADAGASVFDSWCPKAAAKLKQVELLTSETVDRAVKRVAERCTKKDGNGQARAGIANIFTGNNSPVLKKVADALKEAKACGCQQQPQCLWCQAKPQVAAPGRPLLPARRPAAPAPPPA